MIKAAYFPSEKSSLECQPGTLSTRGSLHGCMSTQIETLSYSRDLNRTEAPGLLQDGVPWVLTVLRAWSSTPGCMASSILRLSVSGQVSVSPTLRMDGCYK